MWRIVQNALCAWHSNIIGKGFHFSTSTTIIIITGKLINFFGYISREHELRKLKRKSDFVCCENWQIQNRENKQRKQHQTAKIRTLSLYSSIRLWLWIVDLCRVRKMCVFYM